MKFNSTSKTPKGPIKVQPKVKPKLRVETMSERIERITYQYDENDKKPVHLDDPLVVSQEDMTNRNFRPKQYSNMNSNSYPSNPKQKKRMTDWEIMIDQAKNPKDSYDRESAKQVRQTILDSWKKPTMRKWLGEDELELIGRSKKQLEAKRLREEENMKERPVYVKPFRIEPVPKLNDYMREKAGFQPGITKDLIQLQSEIKKNMDYVMGNDDQKAESTESEENKNDKYKEVEIDR